MTLAESSTVMRASGLSRRQFVSQLAVAGGLLATPVPVKRAMAAPRRDRLVVNGLDTSDVTEEFLGLLRKGGVDCTHISRGGAYAYGPLLRFVDRHASEVTIARTTAEIWQAKREGKIAFIIGSQAASDYIPQLLNFDSKTSAVADALRVNYELGMRTQGISYNTANIFGGGALEQKTPLTRLGRVLVEEIHKLRILLDVGGHTGEQTSLDAIAISKGVPVVCTHTNCAALNPNPRGSSDRVFEAIARTGGVIGVTAISDFMMRNAGSIAKHGPRSPQVGLDQFLNEYDYLKRLVGVDHLALGPDFTWGWGHAKLHSATDNILFPPEAMSDGPAQLVKDFENISMLPNVERGLAQRGWTSAELDKLMGGNWLRVYKAAWGA